jgi:hypothetical protein
MNTSSASLKEIERRAYRSTFEDGIYDILFGGLFLIFAIIPIFEAIGISRFVGYALMIIPLTFSILGKRHITIPRMGSVEFGPKRKKKKIIILIIGAIVLTLTLPLIIMIVKQDVAGAMGWKMIVLFAAPLLVLAVYATDFPRLYIYAALMFAAVVESEFLLGIIGTPLNAVLSFGLPGLIITSIGIHFLLKFIRKYPRTETNYAG